MKATSGPGDASFELDECFRLNVLAGTADGHLQDGIPAGSTHSRSGARLHYVGKLRRWWSLNISPTLEHSSQGPPSSDPRDYLALERTFLAWFRTSVALVSLGVVITQLFVLRNLNPTIGKIFGALLAFGGICTSLVGCARYFRLQSLLIQGKSLTGGWYIILILLLQGLLFFSLFIIVLAKD